MLININRPSRSFVKRQRAGGDVRTSQAKNSELQRLTQLYRY